MCAGALNSCFKSNLEQLKKKEVPNLIQNQNIQSECSNILNSRHTFFFQGALSKKVYCLQRSSFRFLLKDSLLTAFPIPFSRIQEVISPFSVSENFFFKVLYQEQKRKVEMQKRKVEKNIFLKTHKNSSVQNFYDTINKTITVSVQLVKCEIAKAFKGTTIDCKIFLKEVGNSHQITRILVEDITPPPKSLLVDKRLFVQQK